MKTWMFVTAIFWLFFNMCVCPQAAAQAGADNESRGLQTTVDSLFQRWYLSHRVRPPPPENQRPT
jgi:hypothetical protein